MESDDLSIEDRKKLLINNINFMISGIPEELRLIFFDGISAYFKALIRFGRNSDITRSALIVIRDMFKIGRYEYKLLSYILKNIDGFDIDDTEEVVDKLDQLNDRTYLAYDSIISEIEIAFEMNSSNRTVRPREIDSLISNDTYTTMVLSLNKNNNQIKK